MKVTKNRESGQALVIAIILLGMGGLLIVPGLNLATTNLNYHQSIERETLESYSADSGMEYALCKLYNNPGGYTETPLDDSFELNDRTVHVTSEYQGNGYYKLTSTATSINGRSTTIESNINLSAGTFAWAVAGKDYVEISNATITSLPDPGEGNICSNGNINLVGGSVLVDGDASAVGTISGQGSVAGTVTEYAPAVNFPGDYSELYKVMAQEGGNLTGNLVINESQSLGPLYIDGNLTVKPNAVVTLEGTVYVTGTIDMQNGTFDGVYNIVAEGDIQLSGGTLESEGIPMFTSTSGDIKLVGTTIYAVVYAPFGAVEIVNLDTLYGAIGGLTVDINNAQVYWAAELASRQDLPGGELQTIFYGYK